MLTQPVESGSGTSQNLPIADRKGLILLGRDLKFREFHDRLRGLLADLNLKIYIDTSLLMWLLKISATARGEFLGWCNDPVRSSRIFVTTWCAQELYRHLKADSVLKQMRERVDSQKSALDDVVRFADQAYDDGLCANTDFANKAAAVEGLRNSVGTVSKSLEHFLQQSLKPAYSAAETQITQFVNAHTVWTDATNIVASVKPEFAHRIEGRIPPGYDDQRKEENSFGDFIFWREVLEHAGRSSVVILTNDCKTDWIHAPTTIENYDGQPLSRKPRAGVDVQLPHPFLTFEANQQGILQLEIINIGNLALFLEMEKPDGSKQLVSAAYPRGISDGPYPSWSTLGILRPPATPVTDLSIVTLHSIKEDLVSPHLRAAIRTLKGDRQAVESFIPAEVFPQLLPTLNSVETVRLGKAFFRAAAQHSGAHSFADLLHTAGATHASSQAALYLGMLLGIYLSNSNTVRNTPGGHLGQALFTLATEAYAPLALAQLDLILQTENVWLIARPNQAEGSVAVVFEFENEFDALQTLGSISVASNEVLDQVPQDGRKLQTIFPEGHCTVDELLRVIAMEFTVPLSALTTEFALDKIVTWGEGAGLSRLRTDLGKVATDLEMLLEDPTNE